MRSICGRSAPLTPSFSFYFTWCGRQGKKMLGHALVRQVAQPQPLARGGSGPGAMPAAPCTLPLHFAQFGAQLFVHGENSWVYEQHTTRHTRTASRQCAAIVSALATASDQGYLRMRSTGTHAAIASAAFGSRRQLHLLLLLLLLLRSPAIAQAWTNLQCQG